MKRLIIGNQAVAYGALEAGIEVAAGYPGTPSSEAMGELLVYAQNHPKAPYVEWSVNEKVAFELAAGAAWAGKRALATMKMSGVNVASDSILSIAYSGTRGGLVIYVADDPGAEAGMPEQDTRVFALLAGLPVLEASSPQRAYDLTHFAFELSEQTELPVILRLVTSVSHAQEMVEADYGYKPLDRQASFERDIFRFTKAGSAICIDQHKLLLQRLEKVKNLVHDRHINRIQLDGAGGLFAISSGSLIPYLQEILPSYSGISAVFLESLFPLDETLIETVLKKAKRIVIFEELEPVIEMLIRSLASREGWRGSIIGKLDGTLPRTDRYGLRELELGLEKLTRNHRKATAGRVREQGNSASAGSTENEAAREIPFVKHPITFCAGCPHRGTYMALNRALKKSQLNKKDTVVTGDIGCTILGMNPPFDSCWTEVSMGSSIALAQGFLRGGLKKPIIATIGDSTFFHAGIPPLINAVQHGADMLLIILDNGWTSMTGFQINPGTDERFQGKGAKRIEIEQLVWAMGVDLLEVIQPYNQEESVGVISRALESEGIRVVISREECALPAIRRAGKQEALEIDPGTCTFCRSCLRETGCPALYISDFEEKQVMAIDPEICTGCGLCRTCCRFEAIRGKGK